jgi:nucleoside-triphosphatase THEP1
MRRDALSNNRDHLIVIDEIGPMQLYSAAFRQLGNRCAEK